MRVIRAHDAIVNDAIRRGGGQLVKHTGDGVMASFTSVSRAVETAITIQRGVTDRSRRDEVPFQIRVAVGAGEPVTEGDDLFGAAVQLAARVCSMCENGRVLVSSAVRALCVGKGFQFEDKGLVDVKGFDEPIHVYEVLWA